MSHRGPSRGSKLPRILPAPQIQYAASSTNRQDSESDNAPTRGSRSQKRTKVTPVACQPCQQRKSKCDGQRPTCSACLAKGLRDCVYDAAGDQRRTSALKEQIKALKIETQNLKDIISAICASSDRNVLIDQVVATLPGQNFEFTAEVAEVCRRNLQEFSEQDGFPPVGSPSVGRSAHAGPSFTQPSGLHDRSYAPRRYVDGLPPSASAPRWTDGIDGVDGTDGVDGVDGDDKQMETDENSYADDHPRYPPNPGWGYSDP